MLEVEFLRILISLVRVVRQILDEFPFISFRIEKVNPLSIRVRFCCKALLVAGLTESQLSCIGIVEDNSQMVQDSFRHALWVIFGTRARFVECDVRSVAS